MSRVPQPEGTPAEAVTAAQTLERAVRDWSTAFDAMNDSICLLAQDGTVLRCNKGMTALLDLRADEVVGKKCYELMHGSRTFFEKCPYQEMLRTRKRESFELPLGGHWYQVTADPLFDEAEEIVGAVHVVRDITETKKAREAHAERSQWLTALNALALELASLPRDADLGTLLSRRLRELAAAVGVAFNEYDPVDRALVTRAIELAPGAAKTLTAPVLRRLRGTRSPVSAEAYQAILRSASATQATLTEASFGAIPPAVDKAVRRLLGVDRFVGLAFVVEGELYGTSMIALKTGAPDPPRDLLEAFANMAAVSLRRRRAEHELAARTEEVDRLFSLSGDLMGIAGIDGVIRRVNPAWQATLGYPSADIEGSPLLDLLHPDDRDSTLAALAALAQGDPLVGFTNRQRHRDGSYRLIEWRLSPNEGGLIFAVGRDVTAKVEAQVREGALQREAHDELLRTSVYNRSLIEASLDPLVTIGPDGMITDVNAATVAATGCTRDELLGTDFADYFTEPAQARAGYEQVFREGSARDFPLEIKHRDGHLIAVIYNASTYRDAAGQVVGVVAAARDVAGLRRAEAKIRALNASLERRVEERTRELAAANRELQEFVYSVSHDLRSPLRAVDGFSLTVLEDYGDVIEEQGRSDLRRVRAAAQRLGELIDALLSLSRLGRREIQLEQVDLSAIAQRVLHELREADPERLVEVIIADGLVAEGDAALVDVVLENLLGNAWKFTAKRASARIELGALRRDGRLSFFVRDNGAGFDPAYVDKLFTPFQRLHTAEQFPGTGIGLATVARVLGRLGGTWRAEGEVDAGATFSFTLTGDAPPPKALE